MKLFDTHTHLTFKDFDNDREKVIKRFRGKSISAITVGTNITESKKAIKIAEKEGIYASVGIHPMTIDAKNDTEELKKLSLSEKVVAIGETGLDYKRKKEKKQKEVFVEHVNLAYELDLPLIVHCRKAHKDLLNILQKESNNRPRGVIHCFTGSMKEAKRYLDLGFFLGLNGIIFRLNLKDVIKDIPLDKIVLETDCPLLTPPQEKGRNEPIFLEHIAREIAIIRGASFKEVADVTTKNAKTLFRV